MLLLYQQMALKFATEIDPALGQQVANQILSQGGQPAPMNMGADVNLEQGSEEHAVVRKARSQARESTQAD
jgi:hypothetical protein